MSDLTENVAVPPPATPVSAPAPQPTALFPVALVIALIAFIIVIAKLPLGHELSSTPRFGIGLVCGIGALFVWMLAYQIVAFVLKSLVEMLTVALLFANAVTAAIIWTRWQEHEQFVPAVRTVLLGGDADISLGGLVFLLTSLGLFTIDLVAFLVLYPLCKIVGTSLD